MLYTESLRHTNQEYCFATCLINGSIDTINHKGFEISPSTLEKLIDVYKLR